MAAPQKMVPPLPVWNSAITIIGNFIQIFDEIYNTLVAY
ncbi:hypothetical protein CHCC20335_2017 [Bacillus paralicheniformis]|nr:hypothetical protein CHCC20335_2017 [Bacillus paralicheniformis]